MVRWAHSTNQATSLDTLIYWMINALRTIVINPMRDMYVVCLWCIFVFPVRDRILLKYVVFLWCVNVKKGWCCWLFFLDLTAYIYGLLYLNYALSSLFPNGEIIV